MDHSHHPDIATSPELTTGVSDFFSQSGFMPHGHCYLWKPALVWTHVISDLCIGLAYVCISLCLYLLVRRIRLPFSTMVLCFGVFIFACGWTHFNEIWNLWFSDYWYSGFVKVLTAIASVATAIYLIRLSPQLIALAESTKKADQQRFELKEANEKLEHEIAERKRTEQALTAANRELEAFSYSVSHDLRAPIRGINGFSSALAEDFDEQLSEQAKNYIRQIKASTKKMDDLISDLLKLARISQFEINKFEINMTQLAQEIITGLRSEFPGRQVEVHLEPNLKAYADLGLMRVVLDNLISNAWKFTGKKDNGEIHIGTKQTEHGLAIFVKDNGAGFNSQQAQKLFVAFHRFHSPNEFSGIGIGLATVRRIIERHGGRVWAESSPSQGATFYFTVD